jgi:hypothetical protein
MIFDEYADKFQKVTKNKYMRVMNSDRYQFLQLNDKKLIDNVGWYDPDNFGEDEYNSRYAIVLEQNDSIEYPNIYELTKFRLREITCQSTTNKNNLKLSE